MPPLSGQEVVKALERLGFLLVSQRGSHAKLRRGVATCIVPLHRELKRGTLAGLLRQADVAIEDLLGALMQ